MKPNAKGKGKLESRWESGIWFGVGEESSETLIETSQGVIKVRSIRRKASEEGRWNREEMQEMKGLPREPTPGAKGYEARSKITFPEEKTYPAA